jgi:hypothetical protein
MSVLQKSDYADFMIKMKKKFTFLLFYQKKNSRKIRFYAGKNQFHPKYGYSKSVSLKLKYPRLQGINDFGVFIHYH